MQNEKLKVIKEECDRIARTAILKVCSYYPVDSVSFDMTEKGVIEADIRTINIDGSKQSIMVIDIIDEIKRGIKSVIPAELLDEFKDYHKNIIITSWDRRLDCNV